VKEPVWLDDRDARTLHQKLVAIHGGASGIRDEALLASALARPRQHFAYADKPDLMAIPLASSRITRSLMATSGSASF
jgi:death on curing protein